MTKDKSPATQVVLMLSSLPNPVCLRTNNNKSVRVNQNYITPEIKLYTSKWIAPNKSEMQNAAPTGLKRQHSVANYLTTVTDIKQRTALTKYRLSEHSLAIGTGHYKKNHGSSKTSTSATCARKTGSRQSCTFQAAISL